MSSEFQKVLEQCYCEGTWTPLSDIVSKRTLTESEAAMLAQTECHVSKTDILAEALIWYRELKLVPKCKATATRKRMIQERWPMISDFEFEDYIVRQRNIRVSERADEILAARCHSKGI
jgi:hypothetical protein